MSKAIVVQKVARLDWHNQAIDGMSQSVRIAMAHLRKLAQQPRRYEQRTRGMSKEENRH